MAHPMSAADAGSSTCARQKMVRLTKEGYAFLINYALTVNSYPHRPEKEIILARLRAIPGHEAFTLDKLTSWFARHRNPRQSAAPSPTDPHAPVLVDDETILFPKLTPIHLQQLRVLHRKRTCPSDGIVTFWAKRINADKAEVAAWIQYQQEKAKGNSIDPVSESPDIPLPQLVGDPTSDSASVSPNVPNHPHPHLPTPSKSLSPSPHTRMPSFPPIAVKTEESQHASLLNPSPSWRPIPGAPFTQPAKCHSVLDGLPPLSRLQRQMSIPPAMIPLPSTSLCVGERPSGQHSDDSLVAAIRDSLEPDTFPNVDPPKTADEFTEKFKQVEGLIDNFMEKYDTGRLVRLGWDPSLSDTTS